ncbi:ABC transporter substrate-binding protein [Clostridium butyricum]|jgi:NitT/TauT family transport system substrate-binding protein|uniref:Sulfonate ABC transporter substrate-binding protein n=1 Tax=Clostridium butyricum TaxID=1492 RepID=A0A427SMY3_CLOBU|nr:ABC transporter substrate-binding protein [Clostridium butyricum]ALP91408.1 hypothetical protein ATN24_15055 [Clostridium butyricum]ALS17904.1 hypothetical protein ATD26_13760 [Clostridium butyricum]ANF15029.1 hypothetical protein AZ909_13510 [Clostridium butyricum]AOR95038.1 hypothetical protein BBB49_13395 [Clostridium butyricum]MCI3009266.1 ABC transporter substrate-binding protein [Clostridium butyricum]
MKKIISSLIITILMLSSFIGCGNTTKTKNNESVDSSNNELIIGITQWPGSYIWYGTEGLGYFEKEGINAKIKMFDNYSDGMNALAGGNIDAYVLSYSDAIAPFNSGADFKVVMVEDYSAGSDGLVATPDIKSIKDLKGKQVATEIGSVDQMFLYRCLSDAGMIPKDIDLINMDIASAGNAFIAGKVDAAAIWDPSLTQAVDNGGNLLTTTADYPGLIPACLTVNGETLKNRGNDIKKVIKAWYSSLEGYEKNKEEFEKVVSEAADISVEDFQMLMKGVHLLTLEENVEAFKDSGKDTSLITCGKNEADFLLSVNMIDKVPDDFGQLLDKTYIEELAK